MNHAYTSLNGYSEDERLRAMSLSDPVSRTP